MALSASRGCPRCEDTQNFIVALPSVEELADLNTQTAGSFSLFFFFFLDKIMRTRATVVTFYYKK